MAVVGYAAASGRFLEVHPFLRGVAQSLETNDGSRIALSNTMYNEVERVRDVEDPTEIVDEYNQAWWTWHENWRTQPPVMVDRWAGLEFHFKKVSTARPMLAQS